MAPEVKQGSQIVKSQMALEVELETKELRGKGKTALEVEIMRLQRPCFLSFKVQ